MDVWQSQPHTSWMTLSSVFSFLLLANSEVFFPVFSPQIFKKRRNFVDAKNQLVVHFEVINRRTHWCMNHLFELIPHALSLSVSEVSETCYFAVRWYTCMRFCVRAFFINFGIQFCVCYFAHSFDFIFRFNVCTRPYACACVNVRVSHQHKANQRALETEEEEVAQPEW